MKPKTKIISQNHKWQLDEYRVDQSQQIKSHSNSNNEAVIKPSNPESIQGIVKSLIHFFEEG